MNLPFEEKFCLGGNCEKLFKNFIVLEDMIVAIIEGKLNVNFRIRFVVHIDVIRVSYPLICWHPRFVSCEGIFVQNNIKTQLKQFLKSVLKMEESSFFKICFYFCPRVDNLLGYFCVLHIDLKIRFFEISFGYFYVLYIDLKINYFRFRSGTSMHCT